MRKINLNHLIIAILITVMPIFCFAFICYIKINQNIVGYSIINTFKQKQEITERIRTFNLEIAMLKRPDRLHKILNNLGYFIPTPEQIHEILE